MLDGVRTSAHGVSFIAGFEGLRLTAYRDVVGVWTIGYGHTAGVRHGMKITAAKARELLREDLANAEAAVSKLGVRLNVNEFDALVSLVFNCGAGAIAPNTTVGRSLRNGNRKAAASGFLLWVKGGTPLREIPGLVRRRRAERKLFRTPAPIVDPEAPMTAKELQSALRAIGWPIKVDGKVGPVTRQALADFQRGYRGFGGDYTRHPLNVNGQAGPRTCGALRACLQHDGRCSPHFKFREFADHQTGWIKVHRDLVAGLEQLRGHVGAIHVLSGYRDPSRGIGARDSQHHYGNAMDPVAMFPMTGQAMAKLKLFSGIGVDKNGRVRHVDVRHVGPNPTNGTRDKPTIFADDY